MRIKNRLVILIMIVAIACAQWVPAFAVSADGSALEDSGAVAREHIEAEAAIVIDAETGKILYGKDAYSKREPASTTKIVTCMLALEHLDMDQIIKVKSKTVEMGNVLGVKRGEKFTAEQLIYALMVHSANDVAVVLAEEIAGSEEEFCKMMNQKAKDCGAKNTNFQNPNGLNWAWHDQHYTTAYDLAVITQEAMKNQTFRKIVSTLEYDLPATNKSEARHLVNSNKFLWNEEIYKAAQDKAREEDQDAKVYMPEYEGVIGVKTGLTSTAGACMVAVLDNNGRNLIAVVLHSETDERYEDMIKMWEYCKEEYYVTHMQFKEGDEVEKIRVKRGAVRNVTAVAAEDVAATLAKDEKKGKIKTETVEYELEAPVKKGQTVGVVKVYNDGELINVRNLVAAESVEKGGFMSIFGIPDWLAPFICITAVILILIIFISYKIKNIKRERARKRRQERRRKDV